MSVLETIYWGGAQMTPLRIALAVVIPLLLAGYVVWCVRTIGR